MGNLRAKAVSGGRQTPLAVKLYWVSGALLLAIVVGLGLSVMHWGVAIQSAAASYPVFPGSCLVTGASGRAGKHAARTSDGQRYTVVTPSNYRPDQPHPLLLVLAPAGMNAALSERFSGLTHAATRQGFLVAYASSVAGGLQRAKIAPLGKIAADVARQWCLAEGQVFLAGHSDGATAALALALDMPMTPPPTALLLSGAGWAVPDLKKAGCPEPTPVLIAHGSEDGLFPGYGRPLAQWWAACNRCESFSATDANGCTHFLGCAADTLYCETPRTHWRWAVNPDPAIDFLALQRKGLSQQTSGPSPSRSE